MCFAHTDPKGVFPRLSFDLLISKNLCALPIHISITLKSILVICALEYFLEASDIKMAVILFSASVALICYILYTIRRLVLRKVHRRHITRDNNCLPPRKIHQKDPVLGIDIVRENLAAAKEHGFLRLLQKRHADNGLTFTTSTFLRITINTCDPRVIQSILSLQFNDFGMGPLRRKSASPLLGRGIFTSDDEAWAHQRALIRPSFVRAQVTDFTVFERHVDQLISLIARQGYSVDLQALFFRSVCSNSFSTLI